MEVIELDPATLFVPETRMTAEMDNETWQEFINSIQTYGVREPVIVTQTDCKLVVVDGLHRVAAAISLHLPTVPVIVREGTERENLLENIVVNRLKGKSKPSEMVACIRELQEKHGLSFDDIQKAVGLSPQYLRKLYSIALGARLLQQAMDEGKLSVEAGAAIARFDDHIIQDRITMQALANRWHTDEIQRYCEVVNQELNKPVEAQTPIEQLKPRGVMCQMCGVENDPTNVHGAIICIGCWGLAHTMVQDAMERLKGTPASGQ